MINKALNRYKLVPIQVRASFWFLICAFLQRGISVITTPIFTRILTTEEYGEYNVFNSWLGIITVFITINLYAGVYTQGLVKFEKKRNEYSSSLQGLCLTLVLAWALIYLVFRDFWNEVFSLTTIEVLAMFLIIWTSAVFSFWSIEQRVDFQYRKLVLLTLVVSMATPIVGIIFTLNAENKVLARILATVIVQVIAYTSLFFSQMKRNGSFYSSEIWKYALCYNIPLIPHYLSSSVLNSADRIMIQEMIGGAEAGVYSLAYSISLMMTLFNQALMQTIEPWLYKKIKAKQIKDISQIAYPTFFMIAGMNILLIAFAPEIVAIFAPVEYYDAIWIIPPVAMSVYFMFSYAFFAVFEFYFEKTKYITFATLMGAIVNIILNYIFIRIFGYYAAGYTTLVCYIIYAILHYYFMKKICNEYLENVKVYNTKILLGITVGFVCISFLLLFTYYNDLIRYLLIFSLLIGLFIKRNVVIKNIKKLLELKK